MEPFLGEIRLMSFNFAPRFWALCNGQLLQIQPNQALYSILGITYGGDGKTTFGLPDLRGLVPLGFANAYILGNKGGEAAHTLVMTEMPPHSHNASCQNAPGTVSQPQGAFFAGSKTDGSATYDTQFSPATDRTTLAGAAVTSAGISQPHLNMQPYQVLNFCISLSGIYPSRG